MDLQWIHDIRSPRGLCPGGHTHAKFLRELNLTVIDPSGGAVQDKDQVSILSLKGWYHACIEDRSGGKL
jgi:hypothetical protein